MSVLCRYHHTAPISSIYALREALALLASEGLDNCWIRHRRCRDRLIAGLSKLNLEPLSPDEASRLTCITAVKVPQGIDWKAVTNYAMEKYECVVAEHVFCCLGEIFHILYFVLAYDRQFWHRT